MRQDCKHKEQAICRISSPMVPRFTMTLGEKQYENLDRPDGLKNTDCRQHLSLLGRKLLFFESSQHNVPTTPIT